MSFTSSTRERSQPVVPLASMVDVMFLMLTFFMTASAFREQERQINVSLPEAHESRSGGERTPIVITVKADGTIFMTGGTYTLETLAVKLRELHAQFPNESVVIRGDRDCPLGQVVRVMDTVYSANLTNVFLATTKLQSEL